MALSLEQKHKVIFYLGWSGLTIVAASTQFNSVVNDRLNAAAVDAEISRITTGLLFRLDACDVQLEEAKCRLSASKIDSITLNKDEIFRLNNERRRLIRELSDHLDIPMQKSGGRVSSIVV